MQIIADLRSIGLEVEGCEKITGKITYRPSSYCTLRMSPLIIFMSILNRELVSSPKMLCVLFFNDQTANKFP